MSRTAVASREPRRANEVSCRCRRCRCRSERATAATNESGWTHSIAVRPRERNEQTASMPQDRQSERHFHGHTSAVGQPTQQGFLSEQFYRSVHL